MRKKADPGALDMARSMPLTYLVWGLLMVMGLIVIVADIIKPISVIS
jgi:hypothetical protein